MSTIASFEPLLPEIKAELEDLAVELIEVSSAFAAQLNPVMRSSLGTLVRSMNCYYSNLIEGHNTHPIDIDRALAGEYAEDREQRNLQLEARAHIEVQAMIDRDEIPFPVMSVEAICWLHEEFCRRMPGELLETVHPTTGVPIKVEPGALRDHFVRVGRHVPPEPEMIAPLLQRMVEAYGRPDLSRIQRLVGIAASHHRLAWVHPFLDGNGRVTRLWSHALLREFGIGSELWSVSRGLARAVDAYKAHLAAADQPRRGDLDGRGNLSAQALLEFCKFFLSSSIDQVRFMEQLTQPGELLKRMEIWCQEEVALARLPKGSWLLLREAVLSGSYKRSMAMQLTGYKDRQARNVLAALLDRGVLVSDSPKGPVRLGFPTDVLERWLPRLYPAGL